MPTISIDGRAIAAAFLSVALVVGCAVADARTLENGVTTLCEAEGVGPDVTRYQDWNRLETASLSELEADVADWGGRVVKSPGSAGGPPGDWADEAFCRDQIPAGAVRMHTVATPADKMSDAQRAAYAEAFPAGASRSYVAYDFYVLDDEIRHINARLVER